MIDMANTPLAGEAPSDGQTAAMHLLVPSDPLRPRAPDPHFARDAAAARELGISVSLLDHDALVAGRAGEAVLRVARAEDVVYRGWMVTSEQYASLGAALQDRVTALRTSARGPRGRRRRGLWMGRVPVDVSDAPSRSDVMSRCLQLRDQVR